MSLAVRCSFDLSEDTNRAVALQDDGRGVFARWSEELSACDDSSSSTSPKDELSSLPGFSSHTFKLADFCNSADVMYDCISFLSPHPSGSSCSCIAGWSSSVHGTFCGYDAGFVSHF